MRKLLVGQWISALIAGTGIFSSLLTELNVNYPIFLCFLNYALLSLFILRKSVVNRFCPSYGGNDAGKRKFGVFEMLTRTVDDVHTRSSSSTSSTITTTIPTINTTDERTAVDELGGSMHSVSSAAVAVERVAVIDRCAKLSKLLFGRYVFAAVIDVYGNFLIIMAYNYTTITSIMLLDCFTIPVAMMLSYIFLGCRYNAYHLAGVSLCLLGLVCIVISDVITQGGHQAGSNPLVGDLPLHPIHFLSSILDNHLEAQKTN